MKNKKYSVIEVEYWDLEDTINKYFQDFHGFNEKYERQCFSLYEMMEWKVNNGCHYLYEDINEELSEYNSKQIQKVIDKKNFLKSKSDIAPFLNYLCSKGVLESGNYLIDFNS
jgi:hypothetical protein